MNVSPAAPDSQVVKLRQQMLPALFVPSVSQMVIEEVGVLQTQLDIEKSCRENAEALASKVRQQSMLRR